LVEIESRGVRQTRLSVLLHAVRSFTVAELSLSLCTGRTERLISSVKAAKENFMLPWPNVIDVEEDGQRYQPDRHGSCVVHRCLRSCNISVLL